ncbi:MAG: TetR/AcrR family transcriptional regulator [Janthinobacterium lividum]
MTKSPSVAAKATKSTSARQYHHGSLPDALLVAAENVLRRDGLRGLSLRAIAREAGVSHTAPQHHFGDVEGVLSELAAIGYFRLAHNMSEHAQRAADARVRPNAIAHGYIDFAVTHPELFRLMSRKELLDFSRPSLIAGAQASARGLADVFESAADAGNPASASSASQSAAASDVAHTAHAFSHLDPRQIIMLTAAWGYVHGLATLLVDNRLDFITRANAAFDDPHALVDAVIDQVQIQFKGP